METAISDDQLLNIPYKLLFLLCIISEFGVVNQLLLFHALFVNPII
jgi:hypothetical protein